MSRLSATSTTDRVYVTLGGASICDVESEAQLIDRMTVHAYPQVDATPVPPGLSFLHLAGENEGLGLHVGSRSVLVFEGGTQA